MHHPEVDRANPRGYSIHWDAVTPTYRAAFPWWKVALFCSGAVLLAFAGGYFWASHTAQAEVSAAAAKAAAATAEAGRIKATAAGDLAAAQAKVAEQQQRLRLVNDCVYSALNAPLPTPLPTP